MKTRNVNANQYRLQRHAAEQEAEDPRQAHDERELPQERDRQRDRHQPHHDRARPASRRRASRRPGRAPGRAAPPDRRSTARSGARGIRGCSSRRSSRRNRSARGRRGRAARTSPCRPGRPARSADHRARPASGGTGSRRFQGWASLAGRRSSASESAAMSSVPSLGLGENRRNLGIASCVAATSPGEGRPVINWP